MLKSEPAWYQTGFIARRKGSSYPPKEGKQHKHGDKQKSNPTNRIFYLHQ